MKKIKQFIILTLLLSLTFSIPVGAANDDTFDTLDAYFLNGTLLEKFSCLFGEISEDKIVYSTKVIKDSGTQNHEYLFTTAKSNKYNTSFTTHQRMINGSPTYEYYLNVSIGKEAFEYLSGEFSMLVADASKMSSAISKYSGETSYNVDAFLTDVDGYFENNKYMLLLGDDPYYDDRVWFYDVDENEEKVGPNRDCEAIPTPDMPCTDTVFMTKPTQIRVCRYYIEMFSMYYPEMMDGFGYYDVFLNYAPSETAQEGDYLNYELESLEIDFLYYYESVSAPQTGVTTAVYALVGALAAGVVVAKKKKR